MIWTSVALAAENTTTVDGVNYILDKTALTAKVTSGDYHGKDLIIPSSIKLENRTYEITEIGAKAFAGEQYNSNKNGVTSVVLPNTIKKIEKSAFYYNTNIISVIIPAKVTRIEENTFLNCTSLISVDLPEGLTYIGTHAFQNCSVLSSITIPSTITSMGNNAFDGCTNLKKIEWNAKHCVDFASGSVAPFTTEYEEYNGNGYGYSQYRKNEYTTSILFGDGVEYIPAFLCWHFLGITTLTFPNSVKEIGESAFNGYCSLYLKGYQIFYTLVDSHLTSIVFGTGLERIGDYAFYGRTKLSSITIPDKCTSIDSYAFNACDALATITLGKGIKTIGNYAFAARYNNAAERQCYETNIKIFNIYANTPPEIQPNVFDQYTDLMDITLNVRSKSLDAYKSAAVWKDMYVQVMENDIRTFTLSVSSADESKGTTTQGGAYDEDTEILIYAAAKDGYKFSKWNDGNTDNPRTVKMIGNLSFVAQFEPSYPIPAYTITTSANAVEGSVVGGGVYESGAQTTLAAVGNTGYHFTQWNDGNTTNPRQVIVTSNGSYTAQFAKDLAKYTLTTSSTNVNQGTAYGQGKYEEGTNVVIFAVANDGYHFSQWHDGNTENPRTVTVSADAMYYANFAQDPIVPTLYELTVKPANAAQGWTTEGGAYEWGKQLMVYAHPASGFTFSQWSDGNKENPRFLTISGNISLTAQFVAQNPNNINSINASTTTASVRKVIRNGQAFIEYGDTIYTLQGIEVK